MTNKPKVQKKKPTEVTGDDEDADKQPAGWVDTDGLSGEGADSVMAHLREMEKKRKENKDGKED